MTRHVFEPEIKLIGSSPSLPSSFPLLFALIKGEK